MTVEYAGIVAAMLVVVVVVVTFGHLHDKRKRRLKAATDASRRDVKVSV